MHPTGGAFWGMGIGVGCGVGWGPGFGPEVIGYVGAGCGIGFSVGITLAGIGVGLPANFLFQVPYNAFLTARTGALKFFAPHVSVLQREATARLSTMLPLHYSCSILERVERFNGRFFHPRKGAGNK